MKKFTGLIVILPLIVFLFVKTGLLINNSNNTINNQTITSQSTPDIAFSQAELSLEAYEKFLLNENKISFDRFMPKDDLARALYNEGSEFTLSEVLNLITQHYFEYSTNKTLNYVDYSYIDCGNDGIKELILRFNGMDIYNLDDGSTLVYIIKYIDDKLYLCYYYETWARSNSTINEYGYYQSSGSNGASNHSTDYSLVDSEGNWQFIVAVESEMNINQFAWSKELSQIPVEAAKIELPGQMTVETIRFDNSQDTTYLNNIDNIKKYYTFYVTDSNWDLVEDEYLYSNSIYKDIFDNANVPFITPHQVAQMVLEKEGKVGATSEIKKGSEIIWGILNDSLFSDFIGR